MTVHRRFLEIQDHISTEAWVRVWNSLHLIDTNAGETRRSRSLMTRPSRSEASLPSGSDSPRLRVRSLSRVEAFSQVSRDARRPFTVHAGSTSVTAEGPPSKFGALENVSLSQSPRVSCLSTPPRLLRRSGDHVPGAHRARAWRESEVGGRGIDSCFLQPRNAGQVLSNGDDAICRGRRE